MEDMKISTEDMRNILEDRAIILALRAYVENADYINDNVIRQILGVEVKQDAE